MLSFSNNNSTHHPYITNIQQTTKIIHKHTPKLIINNKLQFNTTFIPKITTQKAPTNPLQNKTNIIIFPSLKTKNINYKITQQLNKYRTIKPLIQKLTTPIHNLSHNYNIQKIIKLTLITTVPHQTKINRKSSLQTLIK